ncbi:MAG: hypothetical protein J6R77_07830, partial [Clostridia bacterium]|nr:hypothetical protein [Clostridia bacterium]
FGTLQVEKRGGTLIVTAQSCTTSPTLEGTIPEGMAYTLHDGTVLQAGEAFPETCTAGDKVLYGDYYYGYECLYAQNLTGGEEQVEWMMCKDFPLPMPADSGVKDEDIFGCWLPVVADQTKETYGPIAQSINGQPIGVLWMTFYGCKNLTAAPEIPEGVTSVSVAFYDCVSLETAPVIPASVQRLAGTFHNCTALTGDVVIHAAVDKSNFWYYYGTFANTAKDINLVGNIPEEDLMLIADEPTNRRITVNGKRVEFPEEEEPAPVYYDLSRKADFALTPDEVASHALLNAEKVDGVSYGETNTALYATDYAASCFPTLDLFGYGLTMDELCGLGWGHVDFQADLVGEEEEVRLHSMSATFALPLEDPVVVDKWIRMDVARITAFWAARATRTYPSARAMRCEDWIPSPMRPLIG